MKRGPLNWTARLAPSELQAVHDWIDSEADYKPADLYRILNMQRYVGGRWFAEYVRRRRQDKDARSRFEEGSLPPSSFSLDSLEEMTRAVLGKALLTGEMPAYVLPRVMASIARLERTKVAQAADQRARELHEAKMKELRTAVEQKTEGGAKTLTMGEVVEMVDAVMRGG